MIENHAQFETSLERVRGFQDYFATEVGKCREEGLGPIETRRLLEPQVSFNEGIREEVESYATANSIDLEELKLPTRPSELLDKL